MEEEPFVDFQLGLHFIIITKITKLEVGKTADKRSLVAKRVIDMHSGKDDV